MVHFWQKNFPLILHISPFCSSMYLVHLFGCIHCICSSWRTGRLFYQCTEWWSCICRQLTRTHRQSTFKPNNSTFTFLESTYFAFTYIFSLILTLNNKRDCMDKMLYHLIQKPLIQPTRPYVFPVHAKAMTFSVSKSHPIMLLLIWICVCHLILNQNWVERWARTLLLFAWRHRWLCEYCVCVFSCLMLRNSFAHKLLSRLNFALHILIIIIVHISQFVCVCVRECALFHSVFEASQLSSPQLNYAAGIFFRSIIHLHRASKLTTIHSYSNIKVWQWL